MFWWYGSEETAEEYSGKMRDWVVAFTDPKHTRKTIIDSCMRNMEDYTIKSSDTIHRCTGTSSTHSAVISLPIMLPLETPNVLHMWDYPEKITLPWRGLQGCL